MENDHHLCSRQSLGNIRLGWQKMPILHTHPKL